MGRIEFRKVKVDGDVEFFHVEIYSEEGNMLPVGTVYVVAVHGFAQLTYIIVADQWRREGFGIDLIPALKSRWPELTATSGMDGRGAGLLNAARLSPATGDLKLNAAEEGR